MVELRSEEQSRYIDHLSILARPFSIKESSIYLNARIHSTPVNYLKVTSLYFSP